jgi:hypothetical protein
MPRSKQEAETWFSPFISITSELGADDSDGGQRARALLGEKMRALWVKAGMGSHLTEVAPRLMAVDGWPDAWIAARRILRWDKDKLDSASLEMLLEFEGLIAPKNLKESVIAKVLSRDVIDSIEDGDDDDQSDSRYRKPEQEAERLGQELAADEALLLELLPRLMAQSTRGSPWHLGYGVGKSIADVPGLIPAIRQQIAVTEPGKVGTIFIRGVLSRWAQVDLTGLSSFLDGAVNDAIWGAWFPELQTCTQLDAKAVVRLQSSLIRGLAPAWQYRYLSMGGVTSELSIEQVSVLVDAVRSHADDGQEVAIDLLHMIIFGAKEKPDDFRQSLGKYCISFLGRLDWSLIKSDHDHMSHELEVIIKSAVNASHDAEEMRPVISGVVSYRKEHPRWIPTPRGNFIKPILRRYPKAVLDFVYVPDEDGTYQSAARLLTNESGEEDQTAVEDVCDDELIEWCEVSPVDRYTFAAQTCRLFEVASSGGGALEAVIPALSSIVLQIIERAPDKAAVVESLVDRFLPSSFGGTATAILEQRLALLDAIETKGDVELAEALKKGRNGLVSRIQWWKEHEIANQRERQESFE